MKKILMLVVCATVLSGGIFNVEAKPNDNQQEKMRGSLAVKLNLSEEQKVLADQIKARGDEKMKPLLAEKDALYERMDDVRRENMAEFEKILTPEQKRTFNMLKNSNKKNRSQFTKPKDEFISEHRGMEYLTMPEANVEKPGFHPVH